MQNELEHLSRDPHLGPLVSMGLYTPIEPDTDVYRSLLRSIVGQQLSVKAADTIWRRFETMFEGYAEPHLLQAISTDELRTVGLSKQKAWYLKNIAEHHLVKPISMERFAPMSDEEVIADLCSIKGVGRWTAEMILMFSLARPDVFPVGDLGIRNGMEALFGKIEGTTSEISKRLSALANPWRPYRTAACRVLWNWKDRA